MQIRIGKWADMAGDAGRVRYDVFVREQQVPAHREQDGTDDQCVHAIALNANGDAVGTGRLLPDGHIGRLAVLKPYRGQGVGACMLAALIEVARRRGDSCVMLSAQTHARAFYASRGFVASGPEYMDAGIRHIAMRLPLHPD